ncbi:formin-like protein 7 [Numida meleagris]|uniref:formin-like protein 7 n=1 Tax=Numida meleagris TaxID=8996 RepID=UPI000B3E052C|nr:formin-like protein 7 [Numida meleagris]
MLPVLPSTAYSIPVPPSIPQGCLGPCNTKPYLTPPGLSGSPPSFPELPSAPVVPEPPRNGSVWLQAVTERSVPSFCPPRSPPSQDGVCVEARSEQRFGVSTKKPHKAPPAGSALYGRFVKAATLTARGEEPTKQRGGSESSEEEEEEKLDRSSACRHSQGKQSAPCRVGWWKRGSTPCSSQCSQETAEPRQHRAAPPAPGSGPGTSGGLGGCSQH